MKKNNENDGSLIVDVESTIFEKGNPFSRRNRLCYVGAYKSGSIVCIGGTDKLSDLQRAIDGATLLVGFNIKFDLHWLRRCGISFTNKRVWDCQVAHFLLQAQRTPYPSLEGVAGHYGLSGKISTIADNYWSKGIDTPDIPAEEMLAYLEQDLRVTEQVYHRQQEEVAKRPEIRNLMMLHMQDLLVLQDMEYNGMKFNSEQAQKEEKELRERVGVIEAELQSRCPNTPVNWDSGDDLSAYLYGGRIVRDRREMVGVYATGQKKGQPRYRIAQDVYDLLRLVTPVEGSELKKADKEKGTGPWSTAEDVLKQVKQVKEVKLLLERAKIMKLLDYLSGFPELIATKDWTPNELHGQFNQVVARTGRLSSSNPNLQNLPEPVLKLMETRYASA